MKLNGFEMIRLAVQSMIDGGVDDIYAVTGREGGRVKDVLQGMGENSLSFIENRDFKTTDMLYSVQLGLGTLMKREATTKPTVDAVLIIPGDIPAINPQTVVALRERAQQTDAKVICPTHAQKKGHPLIVKEDCFAAVYSHKGEGGLKQALDSFPTEFLEVSDEGILLDADDPEGFEQLEHYVRTTKGVSEEVVDELFNTHQTLPNIRAHCRAVAALTARMVRALNARGYGLDSALCYSAALLHDLNRVQKHHAQVAADNLRSVGYNALAEIVARHNDSLELGEQVFTEANVVFLADKLVQETSFVTLDVRYAQALEKFPESTEIGKHILQDKERCQILLDRYIEATGGREV